MTEALFWFLVALPVGIAAGVLFVLLYLRRQHP